MVNVYVGRFFLAMVVCLSLSSCVEMQNNAQINTLLGSLMSSSIEPDESTIASGLRQALEIGSERATSKAAGKGGFLANDQIRIPLPDKLQMMGNTLRSIGFGAQVDQFEVGMNRAAEAAASEAKPVLVQAVKQMSLTDVMGIFKGSDTAATDYFRAKTASTLHERFKPVVHDKMQSVGVYGMYSQLMTTYEALPLVNKPNFDLEDYLTNKTQDGLFHLIAQEEKNIRNDPAARTTDLLKRVFSSL